MSIIIILSPVNSFSIHFVISTLTNASQTLCPLIFIAVPRGEYISYSQHYCDKLCKWNDFHIVLIICTEKEYYNIVILLRKASYRSNSDKRKEYSLNGNPQYFKARSYLKEWLLRGLHTWQITECVRSLPKPDSREPTQESLSVVGGWPGVSQSGLKPLS